MSECVDCPSGSLVSALATSVVAVAVTVVCCYI